MEEEKNSQSKDIQKENTRESVVWRMGQVMQEWDATLLQYGLESQLVIQFPKYKDRPVPFLARLAVKVLNMYGAILDIQFKHKLDNGDKVHS